MTRMLVAELARASLLVYSALLLALQLAYVAVTAALLGWIAVAPTRWLPILGFVAFPLLIAADGRVHLRIRGRRRDLSAVAFVVAWVLAYAAAASFFRGSAAHDLDLILDGSHGRFCGGIGYWLDGSVLTNVLFGAVPLAWWLTRKPPAHQPKSTSAPISAPPLWTRPFS